MYAKPHLTYAEQLSLLESRGLACADRDAGLALLRGAGYYRLSAYVYPFRELLPAAEMCVASPVHYRADRVVQGTTLEHVEALWRFDRRLRLRLLDGLELVEVGLRTQVAHTLGARDAFGHLSLAALDASACAESRPIAGGGRTTAFEAWVARYEKLEHDARNEDYVRHHLVKYGKPLPIWVAIEFLDFGAVTRLYELLERNDQNRVAAQLGVKGGRALVPWLKALNYLRNTAAHHGRLWNRTTTLKIGKFSPAQVGDTLRHAAVLEPPDKIYRALAVTAYLVQHVDPKSRWNVHVRDDLSKFPDVPRLSCERDMGFPAGWKSLDLWKPGAPSIA